MSEWDPNKADKTLAKRGLRFADAVEVLRGPCMTVPDMRFDYGEPRHLAIGPLRGRLVAVVYTERAGALRIISLRKANKREQAKYKAHYEEG